MYFISYQIKLSRNFGRILGVKCVVICDIRMGFGRICILADVIGTHEFVVGVY